VPDRVKDDMRDVLVGECVLDLAGLAADYDDAGGAQYAQVLGDQRLADSESDGIITPVHGYGFRKCLLAPASPGTVQSRVQPVRPHLMDRDVTGLGPDAAEAARPVRNEIKDFPNGRWRLFPHPRRE
jgi:hypothetical protein